MEDNIQERSEKVISSLGNIVQLLIAFAIGSTKDNNGVSVLIFSLLSVSSFSMVARVADVGPTSVAIWVAYNNGGSPCRFWHTDGFCVREANRILIQEAGQTEDLTVSYRTMIWGFASAATIVALFNIAGALTIFFAKTPQG